MRQHWALSPWVRGVILLLLAVGALAFVLARSPTDQPAPPSVEEVLGRWREVVGSPGDDGIRTFVARSLSTSYFVGDERAGMPSNTFEYTVWFQAPARQRTQWTSVFLTRSPGGEEPPVTSETLVWDGTDHWSHWRDDEGWEGVTVRRQQPGESILYGPVVHTEVITSRCRVATVTGEEAIDGRDAWILELSRPHCGAPFPGHDGRAVAWIDKATGFVLRARQYSASGAVGRHNRHHARRNQWSDRTGSLSIRSRRRCHHPRPERRIDRVGATRLGRPPDARFALASKPGSDLRHHIADGPAGWVRT